MATRTTRHWRITADETRFMTGLLLGTLASNTNALGNVAAVHAIRVVGLRLACARPRRTSTPRGDAIANKNKWRSRSRRMTILPGMVYVAGLAYS